MGSTYYLANKEQLNKSKEFKLRFDVYAELLSDEVEDLYKELEDTLPVDFENIKRKIKELKSYVDIETSDALYYDFGFTSYDGFKFRPSEIFNIYINSLESVKRLLSENKEIGIFNEYQEEISLEDLEKIIN